MKICRCGCSPRSRHSNRRRVPGRRHCSQPGRAGNGKNREKKGKNNKKPQQKPNKFQLRRRGRGSASCWGSGEKVFFHLKSGEPRVPSSLSGGGRTAGLPLLLLRGETLKMCNTAVLGRERLRKIAIIGATGRRNFKKWILGLFWTEKSLKKPQVSGLFWGEKKFKKVNLGADSGMSVQPHMEYLQDWGCRGKK